MAEKLLDTTGHLCPIPILKARRAIAELSVDDILIMQASDNGAKKDVPNFCDAGGHTLLSMSEADGVITFTIKKG